MKTHNHYLSLLAGAVLCCGAQCAMAQSFKYDATVLAEESALKAIGMPDFAAKSAGGRAFSIGEVEDTVQAVGDKLSVSSRLKVSTLAASVWGNLGYARRAEAVCTKGVPSLSYSSEVRGKAGSLITQADAAKKLVTVKEAGKQIFSAPLTRPVTDATALQYCSLKKVPPAAMAVQLATGKSVAPANFAVLTENIDWKGKATPVVRLYRARTAQDSGLEIWYRQADGVPLKTRITFANPAGVALISTLLSEP
jgi:hypothetical protein